MIILAPLSAWAQYIPTVGTACNSTDSAFWEKGGICASGVWQRPAFQLGASTSQTCNSGLAGMLQWTGTAASPNSTLEYCNGSTWTAVGPAGTIYLGTSTAATNPQRSGDVGTGLYSDTATTMEIATAGVERLRITATGSVGVGIASPTKFMEVNGDLNLTTATGAYYINNNKILALPVGDSSSVALGKSTLSAQTATNVNNVGIGYLALNSLTTGIRDVAIGIRAMQLTSTTVSGNTAVGWAALEYSAGDNNIAIGILAMNTTTGFTDNVAIGGQSARYLNSSNNVAIGATTLQGTATTPVTGASSVAVGASALQNASSGASNTAVGAYALLGNSSTSLTGSFNSGFGRNSLLSIQGAAAFNTALGFGSGLALTTGSSNTIVGTNVGSTTLATGNNNILIGTSSLVDTTASNSTNQLNIGNAIFGDLSAIRVGIGVISPADKLDVAGGFGLTATTATVPSVGLYSASSSAMTLATAGANAITITATQSIGVGTTAPAAKLDVAGVIYGRSYNAGSSTTIDWSQGNNQYTTANCGAFTFSNMQDGANYQLFVQGTTTGTCSFTHSGLTFKMPSNHGATTASTMTAYSFARVGSNVFVAWIPAY